MPHDREREQAIEEFKKVFGEVLQEDSCQADRLEDLLWEILLLHQGHSFSTMKGLEFSYTIKGYEMFVSRKEKSITRSTIMLSFRKAVFLRQTNGNLSGPKKLGTFGASYLYPIFAYFGIIPQK